MISNRKALLGLSASGDDRIPARSKNPKLGTFLKYIQSGFRPTVTNMDLTEDLEKHMNLTLLSLLVFVYILFPHHKIKFAEQIKLVYFLSCKIFVVLDVEPNLRPICLSVLLNLKLNLFFYSIY